MTRLPLSVALGSLGALGALGACTSPTPVLPIDALVDAPADAYCAVGTFYTGEYVDWDSSNDAFLGIDNADWAIDDDSLAHASEKTPPNGRFLLCAEGNPTVTITPDPTNVGSGSAGDTYIPGVAIATLVQIKAGVETSTRSMRMSRAVTFFQSIGSGATYDPTAGQLFVHVTGAPGELSIDAASLDPQAYGSDAQAWGAGDLGEYVYFPNITLTGPTVTLSSVSTAMGTGAIPVSAGHFTYVEVNN